MQLTPSFKAQNRSEEMNLSDAIESELRDNFSEQFRTSAREILLSANDLPEDVPRERVILAILRLSSGDIDRLSHFAEQARKDWRDVLYWAEYKREENEPKSWPELEAILKATGAKLANR